MKRFLIKAIEFYQSFISPIKPVCCKFTPTCSNYAKEAIKIHGSFKGGFMAIFRILRCNPFSRGGCDPVIKDDQRSFR